MKKINQNLEIDKAIAAKVFGLFPCSLWKEVYGGWLAGDCWQHLGSHDGECFNEKSPPRYSSNLNLAWEVVEKFNNQADWENFVRDFPEKTDLLNKNREELAKIICVSALKIYDSCKTNEQF